MVDDGIVLRNGKEITILKVEPINFRLKSQSEQNMIIEAYKYCLKQCNFDFQIFIQTQKASVDKHLKEIKKCILYEDAISDMAADYMELVKEISEVKGSISRKFYIVISVDKYNKETKISKIIEGLKSCGNLVERCSEKEIIRIFQGCFKRTFQNNVARVS